MPITRRQFELGIDNDLEERMRSTYEFLEGHKDEAFSLADLREALNVPEEPDYSQWNEWSANNTRFLLALERLVELNALSEREVAGITYYATGRFALSDILKP